MDFHGRNNDQQLFGINIIQNIFFSVQQKKETHTGLEQLEGEYKWWQIYIFEWAIS